MNTSTITLTSEQLSSIISNAVKQAIAEQVKATPPANIEKAEKTTSKQGKKKPVSISEEKNSFDKEKVLKAIKTACHKKKVSENPKPVSFSYDKWSETSKKYGCFVNGKCLYEARPYIYILIGAKVPNKKDTKSGKTWHEIIHNDFNNRFDYLLK